MSINERNSVWQKTKTQHLIRYLPKGTFYAYFKVGGKPFRKSLRTHVYSVAKLRLADEIAEQRELAEASTNQSAGKLTFADVVELYRARGIRAASKTSVAPLPADDGGFHLQKLAGGSH